MISRMPPREDVALLLGLRLEEAEDEVLLLQAAKAGDAQLLRELHQVFAGLGF